MVDWQKKWFKRELLRPSPLGLNPLSPPSVAAGDTAPGGGVVRGVPCASSSAISSSTTGATSTAAALAVEVREYIDA